MRAQDERQNQAASGGVQVLFSFRAAEMILTEGGMVGRWYDEGL